MKYLVQDRMTEDLLALPENTSLIDAIKQMLALEKELCIVQGENKRVIGILTEVDIIRERDNKDFANLKIRDLVGIIPVISLEPNDTLEAAAYIFETYHNIDQILVESRGNICGVIMKTHLLRWILETRG